MSHKHDANCKCIPTAAVQSLDEMDFERGIWSADLYNDLEKLNKFIRSGETNKVDSTGYTALHFAARAGHLTACDLLLNAGAEVNACTRSGGVTPLIRAALMGHEEIVQLLLRNGANIFHQDNDGNTALHKSVQNKHHHIMKLLVESTNEKNRLESICNKKGLTADDITK